MPTAVHQQHERLAERTEPAALFNQEQLETHAVALAARHVVRRDSARSAPLLFALEEHATQLEEAYQYLSRAARDDPQRVGSEDWLRDNYHVVLEQIREVRRDLPRKYYVQLPKLAQGPAAGLPRVYEIARELVDHTAGRLDFDTLIDFVAAYQRGAPLSIGEIWAIPIMLRVALVAQLRTTVERVVAARQSRERARRWEAMWTARDVAADINQALQTERRVRGHLSPAFVVELLQWLRDQPSSAVPAWTALQRALDEQGESAQDVLRVEQQHEAADQVAMGNVITSMRLLSAIDWPLFFDRVSVVERILREDPAGAYSAMDFSTRDRYRHSVEQLSRRAGQGEEAVAEHALRLAREAVRAGDPNERRHHVGYYLISRGRFELERRVGYRPHLSEHLFRFLFRHPAIGYLGAIAAFTALSVGSLVTYAARHGASTGELWLVAAVVLIPVSELAMSLLNAVLTAHVSPRPLPKLDFRTGVPAANRTMVVVPAIIDSEARLRALLHDCEVRFFANADPAIHFALLTDFPDADVAALPDDAALLDMARGETDALNARHGAGRFFFFHRARQWNAAEGRWMGWERKRGKLLEFNRLLRGAADTSFVVAHGDTGLLPSVKYVITLDSDTQLPIDTARWLVGTLAHPLNRPRLDPQSGRVTEGYGIIQPRISVSVESASRTPFAQVFAGYVGIDPYTTAVSDVYQDLFHEGSYVGKGIYDVDAFMAAVEGRAPENRLLSHDLFEGSFARTALCTDLHLVDDYPPHYLAFAARQHRWVRGDWQIARWALWSAPDASGARVQNTLSAIARWKILDNLRRSLLAPALVALFVAGWTVLPGSPLTWSLLGVLVLAFPAYVQAARSLTSRIHGVPLREHLLAEHNNLVTSARQAFLSATLLLHQAWVMTDAIARTCVRLLVTRRRLLEWMTAERASQRSPSLSEVLRRMWVTAVAGMAVAAAVALIAPARFPLALPAVILWCLSPWIAYATGRPAEHRHAPLTGSERAAFRRVARRIWRFYEDLVGPDGHWLVPDNLQENRRELVAHRTSPTNLGLQLLATLAARDFGYITASQALTLLERVFGTLRSMPRYRGHLYNWYDTRTLEPLPPAYVSTVDSGNFVGYLIALRQGLRELVEEAGNVPPSFLDGLADAIGLCDEELRPVAEGLSPDLERRWRSEMTALRAELVTAASIDGWSAQIGRLRARLSSLGAVLQEIEDSPAAAGETASRAVAEARGWLERAVSSIGAALDRVGLEPRNLVARAERLSEWANEFIEEIDFGFLYKRERQLFSIGFSVADGRLDNAFYDTLASEARLASFVAIATRQVPTEHWFKMARALTPAGASRALLSWSASMFEYLMPLVVMRSYPDTLLDETYEGIVRRHIDYGKQRGVPWGISESAYHTQDLEGNYQYRAFGVPGLGLKRGLADDLVVAPYASLLATPLAPREVLANLARLREEGMLGRYGYYEAIDYTAERRPKGHSRDGMVLPTYMAHHQGMSLLALDNALNGYPMQRRFHADPRIEAAELLLHERIPQLVPLASAPVEKAAHLPSAPRVPVVILRRYVTPHTLTPRAHFLSNGSYTVMITAAGGSFSRRGTLAMTRWREDLTADDWGCFCYVRDLDSGRMWSTMFQPSRQEPDEYEVTFAPDRAVCRRRDGDIEIRTEIVVSPEDDVELRRVSVTNHGTRARNFDLTSYAEIVLAPPDADLAHPAFSNLFVETMAIPERDAILCARRLRVGTERPYLFHLLSGVLTVPTEFETDRGRFIGRGRTLEHPAALDAGAQLSGTAGAVLDPIVSLRQPLRVPPGGTARLSYATGFADTEEGARRLVDKYHDRRAVMRALQLAGTHAQIELRHLGLGVEDAMQFQRLAGLLAYGDPRLRSREATERNALPQDELWKYGISGDLPILLLKISDSDHLPVVRELLKAHEYLRTKGFAFDLVVLNQHAASYLQDLQQAMTRFVEGSPEQAWMDEPGGVFLRRTDLMPLEDQRLLEATARVVMEAEDGGLREQLKRPHFPFDAPTAPRTTAAGEPPREPAAVERPLQLPESSEVVNGIGGFADDGREYVIDVEHGAGRVPPAPWANVVANPDFGFAATESHTGYTWSGNSHDNRLTPWRNDPVRDPPGEAVFIRDDDTGRFWSATPLPAGNGRRYMVRHGQGYSGYRHERAGIGSDLAVFVPPRDTVKVFVLTLRNTTAVRKRCSVTLYAEWVLGENRSRSAIHVVTYRDPVTGAVLASNRVRRQLPERIAFLDLSPGDRRSITGDRTEFVGRNGTLRHPAALDRDALSDRTGAAFDPCGAIRVAVTLEPSEERVVVGLLGDAASVDEARAIVQRYRDPQSARRAFDEVQRSWNQVLDTLVVRTPDRAFDLLVNRWLLYQTLACRIWGRSAFYQSSGAFGFRDQLQDVLALLWAAPRLARSHLLRAASRQFVEGDVQHWWHEPGGQGVRTRFSDDRLWLVHAALQYLHATGDATVLDEEIPFLEGRGLDPAEHEAYETPRVSAVRASLYEHCVRAIAISLPTGAHGLPLIGTGDWNDGMNLVGQDGRGESVWLGWFLVSILRPFADLAESRGEADRAASYRQHAARVLDAIERAWDGDWYRRAYFDDGTPLGSRESAECQIDAIAQAWAVIAGGGDPARARRAMASVEERLIQRENRLVLLLAPPFDRSIPSPGYIQGYVPGVRENGGQYTHAALWTVLAYARLGDGDRAGDLFALLNPINHTRTPEDVDRYRAEPYVVAADVYSRAPHIGRGGWTWYTGSAGWMYRVGIEGILGITRRNGALHIDPCIPKHWPRYTATLRTSDAQFDILVENPNGVNRGVRRLEVDGEAREGQEVVIAGFRGAHVIRVELG